MPTRSPTSTNSNNNSNMNHNISVIDLEDPDLECPVRHVPTINSRINTQFSNALPEILINQHADQQRAINNTRDVLRPTHQQHRQRTLQQTLDFTNRNNLSNTFYSNPNSHIHDNNPIIISDNEDEQATFSDTATVGSTETSTLRRLFRRPNSLNYYSDNENYNNQIFANIDSRLDNNNPTIILDDGDSTVNSNNNDHNAAAAVDDDDDIQIISEREAPDVEVVSSHNTGYRLFTPSGSLFVPSTEITHGGSRMSRFVNNINNHHNNNQGNRATRRPRPSYMRPDLSNRAMQTQLRSQQMVADRRARIAAYNNNASISERVHRRARSNSNNRSARYRYFASEAYLLSVVATIPDPPYDPTFYTLRRGPYQAPEAADLGGVPENIMRILRQRDEVREDERVRSRNKVAGSEKSKKAEIAKIDDSMRDKFTSNLGSNDETDVCILCGVTLIQGIPKDYSNQKDDNREELDGLLNDGFIAPWNGITTYNDLDVDLSKKVFFSSCGHIYCGRCVNNIMRFRSMNVKERQTTRAKYKNNTALNKFENPELCSPLKCVAHECSKKFTGKSPFNEMYV